MEFSLKCLKLLLLAPLNPEQLQQISTLAGATESEEKIKRMICIDKSMGFNARSCLE